MLLTTRLASGVGDHWPTAVLVRASIGATLTPLFSEDERSNADRQSPWLFNSYYGELRGVATRAGECPPRGISGLTRPAAAAMAKRYRRAGRRGCRGEKYNKRPRRRLSRRPARRGRRSCPD